MSEFSNAFTKGTLIDLFVGAWTAEKQLTPEDLGIPKDKIPKSFKLGSKPLIPQEKIAKFKKLDGLARRLLDNMSFPFVFGHARFLPKKNILEFDAKFNAIKDDYEKEVKDLIANFTQYRFAMRTDFIDAAKSAHERLLQIPGFETPLDQYINEFLARIEKLYPKVEDLPSKYAMEYEPWQAEMPDLAESSIDDVTEEGQKIHLLEEGFKKRRLKQMEEYAEKLVKHNRDQAKKVVDTLSASLAKGGRFTSASYDMVAEMINKFQHLNITKDVILEDALVSFKTKYLDLYDAEHIRKNKDTQKLMLQDLVELNKIIENAEQIKALAEAYKTEINI
jgi:hypothetical protein